MKQRSIEAIADYLAHRPIGRIVSVITIGDDDLVISIEDRRDGRQHVMKTPEALKMWLRSFEEGRCLQPTSGFCDCCGRLHGDHDPDGGISELCPRCRTDLADIVEVAS